MSLKEILLDKLNKEELKLLPSSFDLIDSKEKVRKIRCRTS